MTSAPSTASWYAANGPASTWVQSTILMPSKGFMDRSCFALQLGEEFLLNPGAQLRGGFHYRREFAEHLERAAGIDQPARVPGHALRQARVERAAPVLADEVDVLGRIAARAHRPHHFIQIGRVDVLVHHHDEAPEVRARLAARREHRGLLRMPGVSLLDRDHVEHAGAADLVHPDAAHTAQPGALDLIPDHAGLHHALRV